MVGEQPTTLRRDFSTRVLSPHLLRHLAVEVVEVDAAFPIGPHEGFHPPKNPHVKWLGDVGRVGDEHNHCDVVVPQELHEGLHHVALEPVEDEDGPFIKGSEPFTEPFSSAFYFGEENFTDPPPENVIVDK